MTGLNPHYSISLKIGQIIDWIISRTLSYAIVTGLLIGVYAVLVHLATRVLAFHTPVAVAASARSGSRWATRK